MIKYKYKVKYSSQFKKSLKKITKQGKDIDTLLDTIDKLANNEELDITYSNLMANAGSHSELFGK